MLFRMENGLVTTLIFRPQYRTAVNTEVVVASQQGWQ